MGSVMTCRQASELDHAFERNGWTPEDVKKLSEGNRLAEVLKSLRGNAKSDLFITATYTVLVDYGRSIADSVKAGNYNWSNSNVNDRNFLSTETVTADVSMALFHFNRDISSEKAIEEMKNAGYRPATMKEILAFGEKNPEVQREFPIVALGSSVRLSGDLRVGSLSRFVSKRELGLDYLEGDWDDYCRFLAVRNN